MFKPGGRTREHRSTGHQATDYWSKDVKCFNCQQKDILRTRWIKGKPLTGILLDTECSWMLVYKDHVPQEKLLEVKAVAIQCAHRDTHEFPPS